MLSLVTCHPAFQGQKQDSDYKVTGSLIQPRATNPKAPLHLSTVLYGGDRKNTHWAHWVILWILTLLTCTLCVRNDLLGVVRLEI